MYLIDVTEFRALHRIRLQYFANVGRVRYAILSHTWGDQEITYRDIESHKIATDKEGYSKIRYLCEQAWWDGLPYAWIDTCCIDKQSSAELSEAINSMYSWYVHAAVCYVYLADMPSHYSKYERLESSGNFDREGPESLRTIREESDEPDPAKPPGFPTSRRSDEVRTWRMIRNEPASVQIQWRYEELTDPREDWIRHFGKCRWFRRGWTLQELIAPKQCLFFGKSWGLLGSKSELLEPLYDITGIQVDILDHSRGLEEISLAKIFAWAAERRTTRVEDAAYCLLGVCGIHMSLLYGEGENAFYRLGVEITKRSADPSLFAWNRAGTFGGAMPTSPRSFRSCGNIALHKDARLASTFEATHRGTKMTLPVLRSLGSKSSHQYLVLLNCHIEGDDTTMLCLHLRKIMNDPTDPENTIVCITTKCTPKCTDAQQSAPLHGLHVIKTSVAEKAIYQKVLIGRSDPKEWAGSDGTVFFTDKTSSDRLIRIS